MRVSVCLLCMCVRIYACVYLCIFVRIYAFVYLCMRVIYACVFARVRVSF